MKEIVMILPHMVGGGAERVASLLVNKFDENGIVSKVVLTSDYWEDVVRSDLKKEIALTLLQESMPKETYLEKIKYFPAKVFSKIICNFYEKANKEVPASIAYTSFIWQYHREIRSVRKMLKDSPEMTVIAFLQPAIPITVLAAKGLPNKVVISERCDPNRLMKKRFGKKFIKKYYQRVDAAVFQTADAKEVYPKCVSSKGRIIFNPIKENLPEPYNGERNKYITTFCRISEQKNLPVLIEAFYLLNKEHPEYTLKIIGDAPNEEGERVVKHINDMIAEYNLENKVRLLPFSNNVHKEILEDAMYVNTSDYEGISNAMLEAMAIGMPVVCTDCPVGGASATIENGVNGILVPVGDSNAIYRGMKSIIKNKGLSKEISKNASQIRNEITLDNIAKQWMELL